MTRPALALALCLISVSAVAAPTPAPTRTSIVGRAITKVKASFARRQARIAAERDFESTLRLPENARALASHKETLIDYNVGASRGMHLAFAATSAASAVAAVSLASSHDLDGAFKLGATAVGLFGVSAAAGSDEKEGLVSARTETVENFPTLGTAAQRESWKAGGLLR